MATPSYEVVDVTPEIAEQWLGKNTHNRTIRLRDIEAYAADMRAGEWKFTAQPILFSYEGVLIDGQHRLLAIIEAKLEEPVPVLVVRGLDPAAQEAVDTGISRKLPDVLKLRGEVNVNQLAAILRAVYMWDAGYRTMSSLNFKPTIPQLLDKLAKHPELRRVARDAHQMGSKAALPTSITGLSMYLFDQIDSDDSAYFFDRLASDVGHVRGDPITELRRTLHESQKKIRGERSRTWMLGVTIKAWNFYRDGVKDVKHYRLSLGGATPEKFPEPH